MPHERVRAMCTIMRKTSSTGNAAAHQDEEFSQAGCSSAHSYGNFEVYNDLPHSKSAHQHCYKQRSQQESHPVQAASFGTILYDLASLIDVLPQGPPMELTVRSRPKYWLLYL